MRRVAEFKKVDFDVYEEDFNACYNDFLAKNPEQVATNVVTAETVKRLWENCGVTVSPFTRGKVIVRPTYDCVLKPGQVVYFNTGFSISVIKDFEVEASYTQVDKNMLAMISYFAPGATDDALPFYKSPKEFFKWGKKHSNIVKLPTDKSGLWLRDVIILLANNSEHDIKVSKEDPIELTFTESWGVTVDGGSGEAWSSWLPQD